MTPRTDNVPPQLMHKLELAGNRALNLTLRDLLKRANSHQLYDYPVAAIALDRTGSVRLGEGVSTDSLSGDRTAHAEQNALLQTRHEPHIFEPRILVSTVDSCLMCQGSALHRMGHGGIIGSVLSRTVIEDLGHVNHRPPTTDEHAEGLRFVKIPHPRLQTKANVLFTEHVTRDPDTQITNVFDLPRLQARFAEIDEQYSL